MGSPTTSTTATLASAPPSNGRPATGDRGAGKMAPAVRKLVREFGVDVGELIPTGPKGRLTKDDVLEFVSGRSKVASVAPTATQSTTAIPTAQFTPLAPGERERREPLSGPRRAIYEHMVRFGCTLWDIFSPAFVRRVLLICFAVIPLFGVANGPLVANADNLQTRDSCLRFGHLFATRLRLTTSGSITALRLPRCAG